MHMAVCSAELIAHSVKRDQEKHHRGKGQHQRNHSDIFQQLRVFRERVCLSSENADVVNRYDNRCDRCQEVRVGREEQEAFPAVVDDGVIDEKQQHDNEKGNRSGKAIQYQ